jgi:hypothetical protein
MNCQAFIFGICHLRGGLVVLRHGQHTPDAGLPVKKDSKVAKEPWNSSSTKAKTLKIADFGMPHDVINMAAMPILAKTKDEAKPLMEAIQAKGTMMNKNNPHLQAALPKTSINKILNNKAKNQSFNEAAHILAAANIDRLFFYAIEPWKFELDPRKQNAQLKDRRFLYAPMAFKGKIIPVKLTVLEYQNKDTNLYSLEAIEAVMT